MNFRILRKYLFLKLCLIYNLIFSFVLFFCYSAVNEIGLLITGFWRAADNFLLNLNLFAFLSYFLFLLEIGVRYVVMKFVLKKEETAPAPFINNKFLKILDGFYTFLLSLTAFYGFFICLWARFSLPS